MISRNSYQLITNFNLLAARHIWTHASKIA